MGRAFPGGVTLGAPWGAPRAGPYAWLVPRIKVTTTIEAPPSAVWDAVGDISSHVEWMADATAIRFTTRQTSGVGTTFDCDTAVGPFRLTDRMEVTEWEPRRVMGVRHHGLVGGDGRFTLKGIRGGRTRFTWEERLDFPLWFGGPAGALVARPVLRRIWRSNLEGLKSRVESDGAPRTTSRRARRAHRS